MAEQKKARARKAGAARETAGEGAPARKRRTAKAASANTAEVTSVAVKAAEPKALGGRAEPPVTKAADVGRGTGNKAVDVLIETVEAVKAAAVRAAHAAPAEPPARSVEQARGGFPRQAPSAVFAAPAARLVQAGTEQARDVFARAQSTGEQMRRAVTETAAASTRNALEVNGKVLDAWRAQSEAAFEMWHATVTAPTVADAIRAQTTGARQLYETSTARWRDVAETTTRWLGSAVSPMQSAWTIGRR